MVATGKIVAGLFFLSLAAYIGIGAWYMYNDYDVVHKCPASNEMVHVIWPTNLWTYCLFSLCFAGALGIMAVAMPLGQSIEKMKPEKPKYVRGGPAGSATKLAPQGRGGFGLLPNLPDWLFLSVGSALIFQSIIIGILAFWGYSELFLARPWCEDKQVAFEELDLWYFGRVTFFLQLGFGITTFLWGITYWIIPFGFELRATLSETQPLMTDPESGRRRRP